MPTRRTKLFPTEQHLEAFNSEGVGEVFHQFNTFLKGLECKLTNSELTSCRVTSLNPFEVWYDKEVPQQQIDAERYAFLSLKLQEAVAEDRSLDPQALVLLLKQVQGI